MKSIIKRIKEQEKYLNELERLHMKSKTEKEASDIDLVIRGNEVRLERLKQWLSKYKKGAIS